MKIGDKFASDIAREYIEINLGKIPEEEIINHLRRKTNLKLATIDMMYKETLSELYEAAKLEREKRAKKSTKELRGENYYKGRKRKFFKIDDSKLYREVM